jgi:hypothetical protein
MIKITTKKGMEYTLERGVIYSNYKRVSDNTLKTTKLTLQKGKDWFYVVEDTVFDTVSDDKGMIYIIPNRLKNGEELTSQSQLNGRYYIAATKVEGNDLLPDGIKSFHSSEIQSLEFINEETN